MQRYARVYPAKLLCNKKRRPDDIAATVPVEMLLLRAGLQNRSTQVVIDDGMYQYYEKLKIYRIQYSLLKQCHVMFESKSARACVEHHAATNCEASMSRWL